MKKSILNSFTKSLYKDVPEVQEEVYLYSENWNDEDILEFKKNEYNENNNKNIKKRINNKDLSPDRILAINRQLLIDKRKGVLIENYKNFSIERNYHKLPIPPQTQKGSTKSPRGNNNCNDKVVIEYNLIENIDDKKIEDIDNLILKVKNARKIMIERRLLQNLFIKKKNKEKKIQEKLKEIEKNKIKHGATIINDNIIKESTTEVKKPLTLNEEKILANVKLIGFVYTVAYNMRLLKSCKLSFFRRKRARRILYKFFLESYGNLKTSKYLATHQNKSNFLKKKLQIARNNKASDLIRLFIWDQTINKTSVKVRKFFLKVKKCQFIVRSFLECSQARRELLHRHWKKIEKMLKQKDDDIIKAKESSKQKQIENRIQKSDTTGVIKKWNKTQDKVKSLLNQVEIVDKSVVFAQKGLFRDIKGRWCNLKGDIIRNLEEDGSMELDIIKPTLVINDRSSNNTIDKPIKSNSKFLIKDNIIRSYLKLKRRNHIDNNSAYIKFNNTAHTNISDDSNSILDDEEIKSAKKLLQSQFMTELEQTQLLDSLAKIQLLTVTKIIDHPDLPLLLILTDKTLGKSWLQIVKDRLDYDKKQELMQLALNPFAQIVKKVEKEKKIHILQQETENTIMTRNGEIYISTGKKVHKFIKLPKKSESTVLLFND